MKDAQARTTFLKDYAPPPFLINSTQLDFKLYEEYAIVESVLELSSNKQSNSEFSNSITLSGQQLELLSLSIDGVELNESDFAVDEESLVINRIDNYATLSDAGYKFQLQCKTRIEPQNNTALEGLYKSNKMFCTQCEAEGFRRITYYLDRPDVMSVFTTTVEADKNKYPVLLSNGNNVASGDVEEDSSRHWVRWEDPFRKPSYLFALVAGDLISLDDEFTTMSSRKIKLRIFVEEKDIDKCDHAMLSLKNSMAWDEKEYGREYDLDIFMIVAVDDFNMGAMENKGLNIFNTSCVLANPNTQSDMAFQRVEAVVAHEYFHNWSGNRVTCRDWFQLSLKEGFTVFRDSEFSADMGSRTVKRVEDVSFLRTVQFAEDGGPMAHSVRPDSYMEISNFYTVTIYEKGAEVVRMIQTLLGAENFRKGSDLYFQRHDGQAVTTEDFVHAMEDASGADLSQFRRWYSQAGTPIVNATSEYDLENSEYRLTFSQSCPDTPRQSNKKAFHIPVRMGLLNQSGQSMELDLKGAKTASTCKELVLDLKEPEQTFVFANVNEKPIPSLLRGFSAPIKLKVDYSEEELFFLMSQDSDGFNRWSASQSLASAVIAQLLLQEQEGHDLQLPEIIVRAYDAVLSSALEDSSLDKAMVAQLLSVPALGTLIEEAEVADVDGLHKVREFLLDSLSLALKGKFSTLFESIEEEAVYSADSSSIAARSLKNLCLSYLCRSGDASMLELCNKQFLNSSNMTNKAAALRILANSKSQAAVSLSTNALKDFYTEFKNEPLVVDQWFVIQAMANKDDALKNVNDLMDHEAFEIKNPNKVRSLIGAFCGQNHVNFHVASGAGYEFLADQVLVLDKLNPQIASRLLTPLTRWRKFDANRQALMQSQLQRIKAEEGLSKDVFEIVEKSTVMM